jgi:hypothetical protein
MPSSRIGPSFYCRTESKMAPAVRGARGPVCLSDRTSNLRTDATYVLKEARGLHGPGLRARPCPPRGRARSRA